MKDTENELILENNASSGEIEPRFERCAKCGSEAFTRDYLVEGEVMPLCEPCAASNSSARSCGDDASLLSNDTR
jgi:formylmethanofuran dehydrogenase subunit E